MPLFFKNQCGAQRLRMPWGAAVGAGIGLLSDSMKDDKNGGAGSSSTSKEPWAMAAPWLTNNLLLGQNLQTSYLTNPVAPKVQQATDNQYALSDYVRGLVPGMLGQMQAQPLGYDKSNPTQRVKAFDWSLLNADGLGQRSLSNAGGSDNGPAVKAPAESDFVNQGDMLTGFNAGGTSGGIQSLMGSGRYGSFTYGMPKPKPGTQAYRDMSAYFANGGGDPNGYYSAAGGGGGGGFGGGLMAFYNDGTGDSGGGSVGGSPASSGAGGGTPGVW